MGIRKQACILLLDSHWLGWAGYVGHSAANSEIYGL